jgi:hypothetical protein
MTWDIRRREAVVLLASAFVVAPVRKMTDGTKVTDGTWVIELSPESEAIIQELIEAGYHSTREEVLTAALEAMMVRDGWRRVVRCPNPPPGVPSSFIGLR